MHHRFVSVLRLCLVVILLAGTFLETPTVYAASLPAEINKQFTPLQIDAGGVSVLRVTIFNPNSFQLTNASWADNLISVQPGLYIANPAGIVNTCGGTVTAVLGATSFSLSGGTVPPQAGSTPGQCYVEVNISSVTAGNLINTIPASNLTSQGNDGGTIVNITNTTPASATITVIAISPPSLSKSFTPNTIFVGQSSVLTIRLNNNDSDTNLTGASYTDTLPTGLQIATPNGLTTTNCGPGIVTAPQGGTVISLSNATVTPSQDCIVTVSVTGASGAYTIANGTANTIPAGPGGPGSLQTIQGVTNNTPAQAELAIQPIGIAKSFAPDPIVAGGTSVLTITLQNPTAAPYTGVHIADTIDNTLPGLEIVAGTENTSCITVGPTPHTLNVNTVTQTIDLTNGTIPALGTCTITVTVRAPITISNAQTIRTNTIPAGALTQVPPGITNILAVQDTLTVNPALTAAKAYTPTNIPINGLSLVTITVTNNSAVAFTDIDFTDTLPTNLSVATTSTVPTAVANPTTTCTNGVAPDPTATNSTTSVTLANGELAANSNCTVTFYVTGSVAGGGTAYENTMPIGAITACTASSGCVGNGSIIRTGTDLTIFSSPLPVRVAKAFQTSPIQPGQTSRLRITVTAPADISVSEINLTDTLPAGLVIADPPVPVETCPGGTLTAVNGTNTITFSNLASNVLAAGTSCNIDVWVTSFTPNSYTVANGNENVIPANSVTTFEGRTNTAAATAELIVTTMTMSKAFYPNYVQNGGLSTLTITLRNSSTSPLTIVTLTDTLPGSATTGIRVAPIPNATTTCTGGVITAVPGSDTISMAGGTVPAQVGVVQGLCTIIVDVEGRDSTPASPSTQTNTIPITNVLATVQSTGNSIRPQAQAQDILTIQPLTIGVVKGFNPVLVYGGAYSTMSVQLINPNTNAALTGISFTDDMTLLGTGMQLASPVTFNVGTCGGALTGNPGDTSFSFSGGVLPANSSCTLTLRVVMTVNGNRTNRIPAGVVTTFNGVSNPDPTEASLTNLPGVSVNKSFNPAQVLTNQPSTLTITIRNTSNVPVVNMGVADNLPGTLPDGLEVSNPANAINTCGGVLTAVPGAQTIQLNGGSLAAVGSAGDTCALSVDVLSTRPGVYLNTIPSGAITATGGVTNNDPASATLTVDAGVFSLGNRVWFDTDNNSTINGAEVGIDSISVELYAADAGGNPTGAALSTDITADGGYYRFDNLAAGDYVVIIPASQFGAGGPLVGYWSSGTTINGTGVITESVAPDPDNDTDVDDNGTQQASGPLAEAVISRAITLGPGTNEPITDNDPATNPEGSEAVNAQSNRTVDFGFYRVEIGNLVYLDNNGNGNYDGAPDTVVAGAVVQLFASNGTTEINIGPDGVLGTADDAPGGMSTNPGGDYLFTRLPQGQYIVKTTSVAGTASTIDTFNPADTAAPNTNADNNDNGIGIASGLVSSRVTTLTPGSAGALNNNIVTQATGTTRNPTVDFGFTGLVAIGNRVWLDDGAGGGVSNNGILDGGEVGVGNVTAELYTSTGTLVSSTFTDASGYYQFDLLYPGTYYVFIPAAEFQAGGQLETYYSSVSNGTDETSDENADENGIDDNNLATNGIRSIDYTLQPGAETTADDQTSYTGTLADANVNFTADFGFTQKYSLGNRVWFDTDNNSTINGGEVGIDGVTVNLYAAGDLTTILATDTTSNGGYYLFDDLYPGDYVVSVAASNFGGVLDGYWSSATTISGAGVFNETVAALANTDSDSDDNGTFLTASVLSGAVISSTVTLGPSGDTEPIGEIDLEGGVGQGNQANGRANMTVDFGFYTMNLGNLVWSDTDKNGAFNGGETGIDGVNVELWSGDGSTQLGTTTTAGGGLYNFPGLAQGDFTVRVTTPTGSASSTDTFAPADTTNPTTNADNNDNGVGTGGGIVSSNPVTLTPGLVQTSNTVSNLTGSTANPSVDFGFIPVFALGNRVWFDTDNSSTINGAEVGINGVTVNLYSANDLTTILSTQTTVNGGYYLFNNLPDGDYVVSIAASNFGGVLNGYWSSATARMADGSVVETSAASANTDIDSDDNGTLQSGGALNGAVTSSVVTLGPATNAEPFGELDLDAGNQGQPDTQANMTVDFGFYTMTLGDQVWNDLDNSGLLDGAEVGINGVTVELRSGDGNTLLDTTITAGGGLYTFDGLPTGDHIVRLLASNFNPGGILRDYRSSTGPLPASVYEPAPDADINTTNSDDNGSEINGLLGLGGYIQSLPVTLIPVLEESFNHAAGLTVESRVDFGVYSSFEIDLTVTKTDNQVYYLAGGTLNYVITITNNGPADANGMTVSDARPVQITSWTWTCAAGTPAAYNCTDDASNPSTFTDALDLPQLASVTYNVIAQIDPAATGDLVNSITVTPPIGMTELTPPDNTATDTDEQASLIVTKDDGINIVAPSFTTTYTITVTNNGAADLTGIQLTDAIPAGMSFVAASGGGTESGGQVTWTPFNLASGASTSFTLQLRVADIAGLGGITSFANTVHMEDDGTKTGGTPLESDDTDTDTLANTNVKTLTNSNQSGSTNPNVLIGEILTYSIQIDIPVGTINNLMAVDVLDHGLAFVSCDPTTPISSGSLVLGQNPCTTASALTVQAEPVTDTNPTSEEAGRHVTFNFGSVQNNSGSTQTLVVNYQVVVLDIDDNVDGVSSLNNAVVWQWEGGTLSGSATGVDIVEPDLIIEKNVDPRVAALGTVVSFTIDIGHTAQSTAPAYDVLMTDNIPTGLAFVPGSVVVNGSAGLPAATVTITGTQLNVFWTFFPVGETAAVTFQARFVGPSPVVNIAYLAWSSIPIDPNPPMVPQSPYNVYSTERRYDPPSQTINDYRVSSSVTLKTPSLPDTGFAPNVVTDLSDKELVHFSQTGGTMLEIPSLGINIPVVGVPKKQGTWDVTWLGNQAGWLEGSAFPSWNGNSVLTGHVYLSNGLPGPFVNVNALKYGEKIIIHANGQKYTFEVRENKVVEPNDQTVMKHEEKSWLTLVTCKEYDAATNTYRKRVVVRAVLVSVVPE